MRTAKEIFQNIAERKQREKEEDDKLNTSLMWKLVLWKSLYEEQNNGLYAWEALVAVSKLNSPVLPEWLWKYFWDAADQLLATTGSTQITDEKSSNVVNSSGPKSVIADSLQLNTFGQGSVFSRKKKFHDLLNALILVEKISKDMELTKQPQNKSIEDICETVANDKNVAVTTLYKMWLQQVKDLKPNT